MKNTFVFNDKTYQMIKWLVQVVLPALGALYFGIASIWGLPRAEEVVGTLAILATFLGVSLGISTTQYYGSDAPYDGRMVVTVPEDGPKLFSLELDGDPEELEYRDSLTFKVDPATQGPRPPTIDQT